MNEYILHPVDPEILMRQWKLANTLWLAFDQGKTPDDFYALLQLRGVRYTDLTRRVVAIAWAMWLERQKALPVEIPEIEYNNRV